ncbi:MAG: hypothetical protein E7337_10385 [Clostridiales bacterium]|nr:hypothetical protein [Clostridiales bacterium]
MSDKKMIQKVASENTETVFIPRVSGEEDTVFVGLNGRSWQIPRGKKVEVPAPVAKILAESEHNARIAGEYAKARQKEMAVIHGAE